MDKKVKVLFIAGSGRSGSTIIERILSQIEGFTSVGEICFIWDRGIIENNLCSCNKPFNECEHWGAILKKAYGDQSGIDAEQMRSFYNSGARYHQIPNMMMPGAEGRIKRKLNDYLQNLEKLYKSIRDKTQAEFIIDSSKFPSYGYVVGLVPDVELSVLHVVRDARAVSYSWLRKKEYQPGKEMIRFSSVTSAILWDVYNFSTEFFWGKNNERYLRMRYEDFIKDPKSNTVSILSWLGLKKDKLPFVSESEVELDVGHSMSGNPSRFNSGVVKLVNDDEWFSKLGVFRKILISILTFPLLKKYRYF